MFSPPARWGLLDFMSVACSSPPLLSSSSCSTATLDAQCSLSDLNHDHPHAQCSLPDLNHDHPRPVFPAGPQPRLSTPSVPCRTSTASIHAKCSLPDLMSDKIWLSKPVESSGVYFTWAHWHVYILFDRLTCTMTCQVKQMIGIVSWAKVPWQKLQTKVVSTSCFEMSWWGSLEAK